MYKPSFVVLALPYIRIAPSTSRGPSRCASPLPTYTTNEPRPPVITRPLTGATVTVGSRELLELEVDGNPTPTVEWYHDGKLVAESRTLRTILRLQGTSYNY
ncbi:hypothetical protein OESDEN_22237 [Oesophagostomum dentatum]|uniref:Ig-like domain-containing protein n=1 Tax=Oesophagostomum dentatum TaxID=61180 RepID=A0A0B1RYM9_OESDE|nr:hypothetical protein OESDEN_22237 [Oesophagostomum dentatum]